MTDNKFEYKDSDWLHFLERICSENNMIFGWTKVSSEMNIFQIGGVRWHVAQERVFDREVIEEMIVFAFEKISRDQDYRNDRR